MATTAKTARKSAKSKPADVISRIVSPGRSFITLTAEYPWGDGYEEWHPMHWLDIPADWAHRWDSEYKVCSRDFRDRDEVLAAAARVNSSGEDDWTLVFEIGELGPDSSLSLRGGAAGLLMLDVSLTLVRPTAEEVRRICNGMKAVRAA